MTVTSQPELLLRRLSIGAAGSRELEQLLALSQSTVSRQLRGLIESGRVLRMGTTRGARYGLRRIIDGIGSAWPLHRVSGSGDIEELGTLYALASNEYFLASSRRQFARGGLYQGIPCFLQDQRPGGFLGRAVPRRYPELQLPERVIDWNDDHYLRYLTQRGSDAVGDLILGTAALDDYLRIRSARTLVQTSQRQVHYPELANLVMAGGLPGSSAHGEQPKFAAILQEGLRAWHVLVKFSPPADTLIGVRWSDLLVAEHLAHVHLANKGLPAVSSRILRFANRTYLEMDRFDRNQIEGRVGVTSLLAIDSQQYGLLDNWIAAATRLHRDGRLDQGTLEQVRLIATFGGLIANTDRHFGNLAFYGGYDGPFSLAPVYDMLPMLFAPEHDHLPARPFVPPHATSDTLRAHASAWRMAHEYWQLVSRDARVSEGFRAIAAGCAASVTPASG